jgi:hypothetical protein
MILFFIEKRPPAPLLLKASDLIFHSQTTTEALPRDTRTKDDSRLLVLHST